MAKQTTVTIQHQAVLVLHARNFQRVWCPRCAAEAEVIPVDLGAVLAQLQRAAVEEWLNSGRLHRAIGPDGSPLVCLNSLLGSVPRNE